MTVSVDAAAQMMSEAMREQVRKRSFWYLLEGVLMMIVGVMAIIFPFISSLAVTFVLGWFLIIGGVMQGVSLIGESRVPDFWLRALLALLGIFIGYLLLSRPGDGLLTITILLIVYFMISGISRVMLALMMRPHSSWGWVLASGVVGILLSIWLWSAMPVTAVWLLGLLVGINLISQGFATFWMAWQVRKERAAA